jgi:hypothetical protein
MREPERQQLIAFVLRRGKILSLLILTHTLPFAVSNSAQPSASPLTVLLHSLEGIDIPVSPDVERFGREIDNKVVCAYANQNLIPSTILGLVAISEDLMTSQYAVRRHHFHQQLTFVPMILLA